MNNNKLETITNLFEGAQIRSVWDNNKEDTIKNQEIIGNG